MYHVRIQGDLVVPPQNVPQGHCVLVIRPVGPVLPSFIISYLCWEYKKMFRSSIARKNPGRQFVAHRVLETDLEMDGAYH